MYLSKNQWQGMCGHDEVIGEDGEVGFVGALTDAGEYAERLNADIIQFDADVQTAIDNHEEPLYPGFNFFEWNSFLNNQPWDDGPPPYGWRVYYDDLDVWDTTVNKQTAIRRIGDFERRFVHHRSRFIKSGGETVVDEPPHPGIFETPAELEQKKKKQTDLATYATWGLILVGVGVAGYALTSVARVKGD